MKMRVTGEFDVIVELDEEHEEIARRLEERPHLAWRLKKEIKTLVFHALAVSGPEETTLLRIEQAETLSIELSEIDDEEGPPGPE